MRIVFQVLNLTGPEMAERMRSAIKEEDIGWEANFHSSANLWERSAPTELWRKVGCKPDPERTLHLGGIAAEGKGLVWETARSSFCYSLLNDTSERSSPALIEFQGALRGFLAQDLLPDEFRQNVRIMEVEGTYGSFHGEDALERYREVKEGWETLLWPLYRGLQGLVFPDTSGTDAGEFFARIWEMYGGRWSPHISSDWRDFDPAERDPLDTIEEVLQRAQDALND